MNNHSPATTSFSSFSRVAMLHAELADGGSPATVDPHTVSARPPHRHGRVLVRLHGVPLGMVNLEPDVTGAVTAHKVMTAAWATLSAEITHHLHADGYVGDAITDSADVQQAAQATASSCVHRPADGTELDAPTVTVVIATLGDDDSVFATVDHVLANTYTKLDIVVVDNNPANSTLADRLSSRFGEAGRLGETSGVGETGEAGRVRYIAEPQRGLSRARNCGIAAADGEIVVITDDDVTVDRQWIGHIVRVFRASPEVVCVTGTILPLEMETPAQAFLEQFGGFNKGFSQHHYDLGANRPGDDPLYPFAAGKFGSGANIALRTTFVRDLGGFAEDLGAGTLARGGEDLDIFQRVISSGGTLAYEPAALLWHAHRRSYNALRQQMFNYGLGLSATVTKWLLHDRRTAWEVVKRIPLGAAHVLKPSSDKNRNKSVSYPRELSLLELAGVAVGPIAYLRSRRKTGHKTYAKAPL